MKAPSVVSLFSGCGGLDLGFQSAGFELAFAADNDPAAVAAYVHNLKHEAKVLDVLTPEFAEALDHIDECDVLLGGFPCQGFSKAGPKNELDVRNQLYLAMIQALEALRPAVFVAENVDGLAQNFSGSFLNKIVDDCRDVGYEVEWNVVDASWFGVPQHRRRVLIVGRRRDLASTMFFSWPQASHTWVRRSGERSLHEQYPAWSDNLAPVETLGDALKALPTGPDHNVGTPISAKNAAIMRAIGPGQKLCNSRHDITSVKTWDIPEAFGLTSARERMILEAVVKNRRHKKYGSIPNGNPLSLDVLQGLIHELQEGELDALVQRKFLRKVGLKWDVAGAMFASGLYRRPLPQLPAPTVLTNFENPRFFVHPTENRPFTVREAARMQTFPDDFEFLASGITESDAYRLIGNAVPPRLGAVIAQAILDMLIPSRLEVAA